MDEREGIGDNMLERFEFRQVHGSTCRRYPSLPANRLSVDSLVRFCEVEFLLGGIRDVKPGLALLRIPRIRKRADEIPFRDVRATRLHHKCVESDIASCRSDILPADDKLEGDRGFGELEVRDCDSSARLHDGGESFICSDLSSVIEYRDITIGRTFREVHRNVIAGLKSGEIQFERIAFFSSGDSELLSVAP